MAAPPSKTNRDLTGKWVMNKPLSGDFDSILALQGIGWLTRKTIGLATITLVVKQYVSDTEAPSTTHIDIEQIVTGGLKATPEHRVLNSSLREHTDGVFGDLVGRSRWIKLEEIEEYCSEGDKEYLSEGWEEAEGGEYVQSWVENKKMGWQALQIWGFQTVDGKRYHCRKVVVRKDAEVRRARLVYDFISE